MSEGLLSAVNCCRVRWRFPTANDFGSEIIPASAKEFYIKVCTEFFWSLTRPVSKPLLYHSRYSPQSLQRLYLRIMNTHAQLELRYCLEIKKDNIDRKGHAFLLYFQNRNSLQISSLHLCLFNQTLLS